MHQRYRFRVRKLRRPRRWTWTIDFLVGDNILFWCQWTWRIGCPIRTINCSPANSGTLPFGMRFLIGIRPTGGRNPKDTNWKTIAHCNSSIWSPKTPAQKATCWHKIPYSNSSIWSLGALSPKWCILARDSLLEFVHLKPGSPISKKMAVGKRCLIRIRPSEARGPHLQNDARWHVIPYCVFIHLVPETSGSKLIRLANNPLWELFRLEPGGSGSKMAPFGIRFLPRTRTAEALRLRLQNPPGPQGHRRLRPREQFTCKHVDTLHVTCDM